MAFWCKKNSLPTQMHLYNPYRVPTLFSREIIIFHEVLMKLILLTKFHDLETIVNLMKDLNMNTKAFFPCRGGSNLGISRENKISFLKTPAAVKYFSQNCQKMMTFWCKTKSLPTQMHFYNPYRDPNTIP